MGDNGPTRKLTTILSADAAEFTRLMRADEDGTFRVLQTVRQATDRLVAAHQGRVFGTAGDGFVAEFASPVEALSCAVEIQQAIEGIGKSQSDTTRMRFRIGINLGDVLVQGADLIGDGVNVADRIQHLAQPGEICVSAAVQELVRNKLAFGYDDLGATTVKNIAEPIHVYRVRSDPVMRRAAPARRRMAARLVARVAAIAVALASLGIAAYVIVRQAEAPRDNAVAERSGPASIAVLPFENLSGDAAQDYFVEGITEDVTQALGRFSDLSVIAREAVQQFKGKAVAQGELSRTLGVRYLLQGSVRRDGERVRVTATLSDAVSGVQIWSDRYDGAVKDLFSAQDDITQKVVGVLAIKISDIERLRALAKPPDNLQAYDYLQRGRSYLRGSTRADNRAARQAFEQAIALDPNYASAYAGLGMAKLTTAVSGWTERTEETFQQAEALAHQALELDRNSAEAHVVLSGIYLNRQQYDLARAEDEAAIAINPNDADSLAMRGGTLVYMGDSAEALKSFDVALRLNPDLDLVRLYPVGWAYYLTGRYEDAVRVTTPAAAKYPDDYFLQCGLAAAYAQLGKRYEAAQFTSATLHAYPFFSVDTFARQFHKADDYMAVREGLYKAGLK